MQADFLRVVRIGQIDISVLDIGKQHGDAVVGQLVGEFDIVSPCIPGIYEEQLLFERLQGFRLDSLHHLLPAGQFDAAFLRHSDPPFENKRDYN